MHQLRLPTCTTHDPLQALHSFKHKQQLHRVEWSCVLLSLPSLLYVAGGQKFVFTLWRKKHCSDTQILKYTHRHTNASAVECVALCVCFWGLRRYLPKNFWVQKYVWSVIDRSWHCIDRTGYLCEIGLYLHLVNLTFMSGWISSNYTSWGNGRMRQASQCWKVSSGIPYGPLWLQCLSQAMFVCMPVTEYACISVCAQPTLVSVCAVTRIGSLWAESETEWGIKILKTSLGTSGCDWQEKKGSLCSGNWQQKSDPTQYNPAQYSTEPANMERKKKTATAGLPLLSPPYLSWLLANSHNPTAKPVAAFSLFLKIVFIYKNCSELSHSFHFNIRRWSLPRAR